MKTLVLHLTWQPAPSFVNVTERWHDVLLLSTELSPRVEPFRTHEVFIDLTGSTSVERIVVRFACALSELLDPKLEEGLPPSLVLALAPNRFLARLASLMVIEEHPVAPQGLSVRRLANIPYAEVPAAAGARFVAPLGVHRLWCVPAKAIRRLTELGISSLNDLCSVPRQHLVNELGSELGSLLLLLAGGIDPTPVQPLYPPRTVEVYWESNKEHSLHDRGAFTHVLGSLARRLSGKLRSSGEACSSLVMRIECADQTIGQALKLQYPTCTESGLEQAALRLFERFHLSAPPYRITLSAGDLGPPHSLQPDLFSGRQYETKRRVDQVLTRVQRRFGMHSIQYAATLRKTRRERMRALWHDTVR